MARILEQEVMEDQESVDAYASFDKTKLIELYQGLLGSHLSLSTKIADLGCGSGDCFSMLTTACPNAYLVGIDASFLMLKKAVHNCNDRVILEQRHLPDETITRQYDGVSSIMFLHQLADPQVLWNTIKQITTEGGKFFVVDMIREEDLIVREQILDSFATKGNFRTDFDNSLKAAFTEEEIKQQLVEANIAATVEVFEGLNPWKIITIKGTV